MQNLISVKKLPATSRKGARFSIKNVSLGSEPVIVPYRFDVHYPEQHAVTEALNCLSEPAWIATDKDIQFFTITF
jgi:hypothetical protein